MRNSSNVFNSILKGNFAYILLGGALIILLPIIFVFNSYSSENLSKEEPTPTGESQQSASGGKAPANRISPTKNPTGTTISDEKNAVESGPVSFSNLSEIANDAQKQTQSDGSVIYTFESLHPNRSDMIIVKNGSIIFSRHAVVGVGASDKYKSLLEKQAKTIQGPTFYGPNTLIYFYENGGTALIANPQTDTTYEEFTFQPPVSLAEFNSTYKKYTL